MNTKRVQRNTLRSANPPGHQLLKVREAARSLGCGKTLVNAFVKTGDLRSVKFGRCRRISVAALREFIDKHSIVEPTPDGKWRRKRVRFRGSQ